MSFERSADTPRAINIKNKLDLVSSPRIENHSWVLSTTTRILLTSDLGVNYNTITRVYQKLREAIYQVIELQSSKIRVEIEIYDAYSGERRKLKRGRGIIGKCNVFGI